MLSRVLAGVLERAERARQTAQWIPTRVRFALRGHQECWKTFTHMTSRERLLLYRLGRIQTPGCVLLEVGSYLGASAGFLAAATRELGGGSRVHCVDTWKNQGMTEGPRDTWETFCQNTLPYADQIVAHRGLSVDIARSFEERIDLLFLDGDHSYEGCRADIEAWLPHLTNGGVLVMHDIGWAEGVQRVVRELVRNRESQPGHTLDNIYWTRL